MFIWIQWNILYDVNNNDFTYRQQFINYNNLMRSKSAHFDCPSSVVGKYVNSLRRQENWIFRFIIISIQRFPFQHLPRFSISLFIAYVDNRCSALNANTTRLLFAGIHLSNMCLKRTLKGFFGRNSAGEKSLLRTADGTSGEVPQTKINPCELCGDSYLSILRNNFPHGVISYRLEPKIVRVAVSLAHGVVGVVGVSPLRCVHRTI